MPFTVKELLEGRNAPLTIAESAKVAEALQLMEDSNVSRLAVVGQNDAVIGLLTYQSIVESLEDNHTTSIGALKVTNAVDRDTRKYAEDTSIFKVLEGLQQSDAVLIRDQNDRILQIITIHDVALYFRGRAEDMMLIEDIESILKECILADLRSRDEEFDENTSRVAINEGEDAKANDARRLINQVLKMVGFIPSNSQNAKIQDAVNIEHGRRAEKPFHDLTLGQYISLFVEADRYSKYEDIVGRERKACRELLLGVNQIRNKLFHFRSKLSTRERNKLKRFLAELETKQDQIIRRLRSDEKQTVTIEELVPEKPGAAAEAIVHQVEEAVRKDPQLIIESTGVSSGVMAFFQTVPPGIEAIQFKFNEFAEINGSSLPKDALTNRLWWTNDSLGQPQAKQWLDVGWRVSSVNLGAQHVDFARIKGLQKRYIRFFNEMLTVIRREGVEVKGISPSGDKYLKLNRLTSENNDRIGFVGCSFLQDRRFRVEFYLNTGNQNTNRFIFDGLAGRQNEIEEKIGAKLQWERSDEKDASMIALYHDGSITDDSDKLNALTIWAAKFVTLFDSVFVRSMADDIIELYARSR